MSAEQKVLNVSPNPITLGQPFQILVVPPAASPTTCAWSASISNFYPFYPLPSELHDPFVTQAVIYGCPSLSGAIESGVIYMKCDFPTMQTYESTISIRSAKMTADLKTPMTNSWTASLNLTTPFPVTIDVCSLSMTEEKNTSATPHPLCPKTGECAFDMLGDTSVLLQSQYLPKPEPESEIEVKCTGGFGKITDCQYVRTY